MFDKMDDESITDWVRKVLEADGDMCIHPPFKQKSIYWKGSVESLPRVVCGEKNGRDVDLMLVPIRTCGTLMCANGRHYRWGTRSEAMSHKSAPRNHAGERNPNSKLTWEIVRDIRSRVSAAPAWKAPKELEKLAETRRANISSHHEAMTRRALAMEYGVTLKTIDRVVSGKVWVENVDDEF